MSPLRVAVLGTTVDVTAPDPVRGDLEGSLADLTPVVDADARPPDRTLTLQATAGSYDLLDGTDVVRAGIDPSVAAATVMWHLNTIATRTSPHLILHAAAVAAPGGGVVVLAGASGAGKSTLAAACLAAGLQYLTDELVAIDLEAGLIVPYPKPLSLEHQPLVPARSLGTVVDGRPATRRGRLPRLPIGCGAGPGPALRGVVPAGPGRPQPEPRHPRRRRRAAC